MPDAKITELPSATLPLDGTELMEVVQGGVNKKVAKSDVATGGGGTVTSVTGTASRITSSGGATPVIDIAAAYDTAVTNAINAKVTQTITNGVTTTAPSEDAVFDALALKLAITDFAKYVIDQASPSTAGGTITLDCNSQIQRSFVGSATFAAAKIMALSNTTNTLFFNFIFEITNVAAVLTFPSDWLFPPSISFNGTDWTPPAIGKYEMGGSFDDVNNLWYIKITGPNA